MTQSTVSCQIQLWFVTSNLFCGILPSTEEPLSVNESDADIPDMKLTFKRLSKWNPVSKGQDCCWVLQIPSWLHCFLGKELWQYNGRDYTTCAFLTSSSTCLPWNWICKSCKSGTLQNSTDIRALLNVSISNDLRCTICYWHCIQFMFVPIVGRNSCQICVEEFVYGLQSLFKLHSY